MALTPASTEAIATSFHKGTSHVFPERILSVTGILYGDKVFTNALIISKTNFGFESNAEPAPDFVIFGIGQPAFTSMQEGA